MPLPWVSRTALDGAETELATLRQMLALHEGRTEDLKAALARSEAERADLQNKLLRVGFGYSPFEQPAVEEPVATVTSEPQPWSQSAVVLPPNASPDQVQAAYTAEARSLYGRNARKIQHHVQSRLNDFYSGRYRTPVGSDQHKAQTVIDDLHAAFAEGQASVAV